MAQHLRTQHDSASDVILAVDTATRPNLIRDRIKMNSQRKGIAALCIREEQRETGKGAAVSNSIGNRLIGNGTASTYLSPLNLENHAEGVQLGNLVNSRVSKRANSTRNPNCIGNDVEDGLITEKSAHTSTTLNAPAKAKWSIKSAKMATEDKIQSHHCSDTLFLKATNFQARTLERILHRKEALSAAELEGERKPFTDSRIMKGEDEERTLRMNELRKKTLARLIPYCIRLLRTCENYLTLTVPISTLTSIPCALSLFSAG